MLIVLHREQREDEMATIGELKQNREGSGQGHRTIWV
jgi:hypothetical protein